MHRTGLEGRDDIWGFGDSGGEKRGGLPRCLVR